MSGRPASKGGAGAYSSASCTACAVLASVSSAASVSAKSIPAVTPPPVIILPSLTTRAASGTAPKTASKSRYAQWQAARFPLINPAAPSRSEPVHTDVTYFAFEWRQIAESKAIGLNRHSAQRGHSHPGTWGAHQHLIGTGKIKLSDAREN